MSKTTRKTYSAKFKMAVALDVVRGEKTLSQVASEHGVSPSLASEWRDELLGSADDVFGKRKQDRERRESEAAASKRYDEALRTIGQLTVERDFLRRFCDDNGYDPEEARGGSELPDGLSRARACELLGVSRAMAYRDMARPEAPEGDRWSDEDERLAALVDREHVAHPAFGARKIAHVLREAGEPRATRWRVTRLMGLMGTCPLCPLPSLSKPAKASRRFLCLVKPDFRFSSRILSGSRT